ncbi:MAG TPA: hypothetical protein VHD62_15585 [Opitutaceae bacterium]|nr:hypothetical protein [Opitutaceae bacterium]
MSRPSNPRLLVFSALALALGSAATFAVRGWRESGGPARAENIALAAEPYVPAFAEPTALRNDTWNPPPPQTRGRDWVYDAFTPPEIFYNARARQFTVKPPAGLGEDEPEEPFGLELVAVRPEPFRLQLIGYAGEEGHWRGTFENVATGEVFLAPAGRRVAALALSIQRLDVSPQPVAVPESMTTRQRIATAVVHDERTGRDLQLTQRERQLTDTLSAVVATAGEGSAREVRAGETFRIGESAYRIDRIQLSPPVIEVTKESPNLAQPDRRTLAPREVDPADNAAPSSSSQASE